VGFLLLISLSLLALFNDLQRYFSPWIFWFPLFALSLN
jgi:hypothetical protein